MNSFHVNYDETHISGIHYKYFSKIYNLSKASISNEAVIDFGEKERIETWLIDGE